MSASPRTFWLCWGAGFLLWIASLVIAAPWDLELSMAVANREASFGQVIARFGEWPAWLLVAASLVVLVGFRKPGSKLSHLRPLAWAVLILALLHPLLITQSVKYFWGRVRFRDLGVDFSGFTRFYFPAGIGAGLSFPSGHVAMAAVFSAVPFCLFRNGSHLRAAMALALVLGFVLAVAWGRILAGAHYLTDCIFSAGLSLLLAAVLARALTPTARPSGGVR